MRLVRIDYIRDREEKPRLRGGTSHLPTEHLGLREACSGGF